jgi:glucose-1-phosphate thymidylyltransferase
MKGIILAGGMGTRLHPLTQITNKNLLPVYDKPMILYAIDTLKRSGVTDIMIVCEEERSEEFIKFLGTGEEYGVKLSFAFQDGYGGVGHALAFAEGFARGEKFALIFGDNFFEDVFADSVERFKKLGGGAGAPGSVNDSAGAMIFLKKVPDPHRFGIAEMDEAQGKITSIKEKPKEPKSDLAIVGFYLYDETLFDRLRTLKPSERGELEVTDILNQYLDEGRLHWSLVPGFWSDMGTFESLHATAAWVAERKKNA